MTDRITALFYGASGAGKTYLTASACLVPELAPVVYFDTEDARMSARIFFQHEDLITRVPVHDRKGLALVHQAMTDGPGKFKTIVVNSITEWYWRILELHMADEGRGGQQPQLQNYGYALRAVMSFLRVMQQDADYNFLGVAGLGDYKDESTGIAKVRPDAGAGQMWKLGRRFYVVGHLSADVKRSGGQLSVQRTLQVVPYRRVEVAKDETGRLGAAFAIPEYRGLEDQVPPMKAIWDAIFGGENATRDDE